MIELNRKYYWKYIKCVNILLKVLKIIMIKLQAYNYK
jgi:hypothetical protein